MCDSPISLFSITFKKEKKAHCSKARSVYSLQGAHMDERERGCVRRRPVLPAHHGLRAEDRT